MTETQKAFISVCIITKNEKDKLDCCLKALAKYPFELVVVDTGSEDGSKQLARRYTDKVYNFKWIDDFSAARNYAAQAASNDYVLMVDTDEVLQEIDYDEFCRLVQSNETAVGRIRRVNIFNRDGEEMRVSERVNRLYNRRKFRYRGAIHEQISAIDNDIVQTYELPASFDHSGYDGTSEQIKEKADRNIELLMNEYADNPEDTYILYQLGKSFYMKQDYQKSYEFFHKAACLELDERLEYVADLIVSYGYSMLNTGRSGEALLLEQLYDLFGHLAEFRFVMGLIYMNNMMFDKAYDMFMSAVQAPCCNTEGVNSYKAYYNAGVIRECLGDTKEALRLYGLCGNYRKAAERIDALLQK